MQNKIMSDLDLKSRAIPSKLLHDLGFTISDCSKNTISKIVKYKLLADCKEDQIIRTNPKGHTRINLEQEINLDWQVIETLASQVGASHD